MRILGIDPGKNGAVAVADAKGVQMVELMPENMATLADWLIAWEITHVYLEKPFAMPGKTSGMSMLSFGIHCGTIQGIVIAKRIPFTLIQPQTWMKKLHVGTSKGTSKERSIESALRMYPHINFMATQRSKKPHDGLCEAAHIAEFGRREQLGK